MVWPTIGSRTTKEQNRILLNTRFSEVTGVLKEVVFRPH